MVPALLQLALVMDLALWTQLAPWQHADASRITLVLLVLCFATTHNRALGTAFVNLRPENASVITAGLVLTALLLTASPVVVLGMELARWIRLAKKLFALVKPTGTVRDVTNTAGRTPLAVGTAPVMIRLATVAASQVGLVLIAALVPPLQVLVLAAAWPILVLFMCWTLQLGNCSAAQLLLCLFMTQS